MGEGNPPPLIKNMNKDTLVRKDGVVKTQAEWDAPVEEVKEEKIEVKMEVPKKKVIKRRVKKVKKIKKVIKRAKK